MPQNVIEKITQHHLAENPTGRTVHAGDFVSIRPRHVMTHDNTAAVMKKFRSIGVGRIADPAQPIFALDHDIQNRSEENLAKYREIESFAREHGVRFYPAGTGIGHQILVECGHAVPGSFVVASDSHSNMYGGVGALGTPVVRTDAAAIWATGEFWWQIPPVVQVHLTGRLRPGVAGKDVVLALCGLYPREVLNAAVEFSGAGVGELSVEARLAIANMTTEWGALVGWFPFDERTRAYLAARHDELDPEERARLSPAHLDAWSRDRPRPDPGASYAARIDLDLDVIAPQVAGPDTVQRARPLQEVEAERIAIQKAYLVSCANARIEDLEAAAEVLDGRSVASGVELYVAPASRKVQAVAEARGTWQTLLAAGARPLPAGCGPCIGLGTGLLEPGQVGISATNRNFKGRMGSRQARCYLASPAVVAASAAAGYICGPEPVKTQTLTRRFETLAPPAEAPSQIEILEGFPRQLSGRLVFVTQDNLNTDGIYGKDYTYREDMTPEKMAAVVMENYDPGFGPRTRPGDVLVGGANFGTGSSREQAVTALAAKGFRVVVAASFSQTYLRNAFNNGFPCIECPALVAHLRESAASPLPTTVVYEDAIEIDFAAGTLAWQGRSFPFAPLSEVPQSLVVAGGVENWVRRRLEPTAGG